MQNFSLTINDKNYQVNIIEAMDKYGKNKEIHFSEIPLIEFNSEDGKFIRYDVITVLDSESDMLLPNNDKPISSTDRKKINEKLFEIYPGNYLNMFIGLKPKKPKM